MFALLRLPFLLLPLALLQVVVRTIVLADTDRCMTVPVIEMEEYLIKLRTIYEIYPFLVRIPIILKLTYFLLLDLKLQLLHCYYTLLYAAEMRGGY